MMRTWGWAGLLALVAGCGSSTPVTPDGDDDDLLPSIPIGYGSESRLLTVDGHPRGYDVHVPASVDLDAPARVLMVLHGFPPVDMSRVTGMNGVAEERGFVTVYPESAYAGQWVHSCRCTPNGMLGIDDIAYFDALLAELDAALPGGLEHAFVTGFSNGGMMTYTLACKRPSTFAGFAVVGGGMWTHTIGGCRSTTPAPLLIFAGTADPQFPWQGTSFLVSNGARMTQETIPATIEFWAEKNGCEAEPAVTPLEDRYPGDGTTVEHHLYQGCSAPTAFFRIEGGGHTWPDQEVPFGPALGAISQEVSASRAIVDFWLGAAG